LTIAPDDGLALPLVPTLAQCSGRRRERCVMNAGV